MEKLQGDARDYLNSKRASQQLIEGPGKKYNFWAAKYFEGHCEWW